MFKDLVFLGLDLSHSKIGLAIVQNNKMLLVTSFKTKDFKQIIYYKLKYKPVHSFIGLSINKRYEKDSSFNFIKNFTHEKRDILKPFSFVDESYSTLIAATISHQLDEISALQIAFIGAKDFYKNYILNPINIEDFS